MNTKKKKTSVKYFLLMTSVLQLSLVYNYDRHVTSLCWKNKLLNNGIMKNVYLNKDDKDLIMHIYLIFL